MSPESSVVGCQLFEGPQLRLYEEGSGFGVQGPSLSTLHSPLSPALTLPEFYESFVYPQIRAPEGADEKTVSQDRESLRLWAAMSGDPSLERIDQALLGRFVAALKARRWRGKPLSVNTIRKHETHLQFTLDLAGPPRRRSRPSARLLAEVPFFPRPAERRKPAWDSATVEEVSLWLRCCRFAPDTKNIPPEFDLEHWWQGLIGFCWATCLRIESVLLARREDIGRDPTRPDWITIPPENAKRGAGGDFYLSSHARAWLAWARTPRQRLLFEPSTLDGLPSGLLFPWNNWPNSKSWFCTCRRRMLQRSEIPPARRPGFHWLRKGAGTWLRSRNVAIADKVLGHRSSIGTESYLTPAAVVELLEALPQPRLEG